MPPDSLDTPAIQALLEQAMRTVNSKVMEKHSLTPDLLLTGVGGVLDSLDAMLFLDEVEELLGKRTKLPVKLVTEASFARQPSPFLSVRSLSAYIAEVLAALEAAAL